VSFVQKLLSSAQKPSNSRYPDSVKIRYRKRRKVVTVDLSKVVEYVHTYQMDEEEDALFAMAFNHGSQD
jgi:hypothetical protein